jgi:hypothetical protein
VQKKIRRKKEISVFNGLGNIYHSALSQSFMIRTYTPVGMISVSNTRKKKG